jgi:hypothetical protein
VSWRGHHADLLQETEHIFLRPFLDELSEPEGREFESLGARKAFDLPKLFLRLLTKSQTSDFPMTLAKWFFENSLVDSKGLEFYHHH